MHSGEQFGYHHQLNLRKDQPPMKYINFRRSLKESKPIQDNSKLLIQFRDGLNRNLDQCYLGQNV